MEHLLDRLLENRDSGIYPYHMPGHKRQACGKLSRELCGIDITEIDGFDNLHQPEGILLRLQQEAARLYGAEESFYLVNGSTAGILSAVSAAVPQGGHILMGRNCHRSAYHAAGLRNLKISYLYPPVLSTYDICDRVSPQQVKEALDAEPDIDAVLLVSPTYEGRISDIQAIAEITRERGIPLIVDEAHGAHLGFGPSFAPNSCRAGADLVIHSIHKTLPALTQTALLHVSGELIDRRLLRRFLQVYQTSSPSYLLMASIDNALEFVEREGQRAFGSFAENYSKMLEDLSACRHLRFLPWERAYQDIGKLVISVKGTGMSGRELYDTLLQKYRLQPEMAAESYVLAMFTVNDSAEAYERMTRALLEIDGTLTAAGAAGETAAAESIEVGDTGNRPVCRYPLSKAWEMESVETELEESVGHPAGEFVNLYPPGAPVLVPGEEITPQLCSRIRTWVLEGLTVQGARLIDDKIYVRTLVQNQGKEDELRKTKGICTL